VRSNVRAIFWKRARKTSMNARTITAYNGKSVEICGSPKPQRLPKQFPRKRVTRFLILFRGVNIHGELIDEYYICPSAEGKHWFLFVGGYDQNDESTFCHSLLGWCSARGIGQLEAASALFRAYVDHREQYGEKGPCSILWFDLFSEDEIQRFLAECGFKVEPVDFHVDHPQYRWIELME
jgi:hypothetical protein